MSALPHSVPFIFFLCSSACFAQQDPGSVEFAARTFIEEKTRGLPGEVSIEISSFDSGNHLPPCRTPAIFLPASTRAWGAFSVGVRCEQPTPWTAYLQARVKVFQNYLVLAHSLSAGQIIGVRDIALHRGDIAALPDDVLTDTSQAVGRTTRWALAQGMPLQTRMLRIPNAVQQGSSVTVNSSGAGFTLSNTGRALNSAAPGEAVKVRLPNNRVITGTAQTNGTVEISP